MNNWSKALKIGSFAVIFVVSVVVVCVFSGALSEIRRCGLFRNKCVNTKSNEPEVRRPSPSVAVSPEADQSQPPAPDVPLRQTSTVVVSRAPSRKAKEEEKVNSPERDGAEIIRARIRWFKKRHPEMPPAIRLKVIKAEYQNRQAEKIRPRNRALNQEARAWTSLGPHNGAGRVSSIAVHPTAMGTVYIGADGGGVWKTTDGGTSWVNLTDSVNNLNVGAITLAPSSPNIVYVGTGSEHASGIGLLKSNDGGNTWLFPSSVLASSFSRLSVHPTNPLDVIAATSNGGFRSLDGGVTWDKVIAEPYIEVRDLKRDPSNPFTLYASANVSDGGRILKSTNGGTTFDEKMTGLPTNSDDMSIAITPANPLVLYVLTSIQSDLTHIYKSTTGGESWTDLPSVFGSSNIRVRKLLGNQAWHDNTIIVSPANPNIITAGGVAYIRSTNGGQTWTQPFCTPICSNVHDDWTDQQYQGTRLWIANDGGVFSSATDTSPAFDHNNGLVIREFYAMFNHPTQIDSLLAGSKDNGTDFRSVSGGETWFSMSHCDSFDTSINRLNPNIAYTTCQNGTIARTTQFQTNPDILLPPGRGVAPQLPAGEEWPFEMTLITDQIDPLTLYTLTKNRVWKTTTGGDSWTALSTTTTDGSTWSGPTRLAVSKSNPNVLMTASGPQAFRSTDAGNSWVRKTVPSQISSLEIDPADSNNVYLATSGCDGCPQPSFFASTDGGTTWQPRNSGLPPGAVLVIRVDPANSNRIFSGTYTGVYVTGDRGNNWVRLGTGFPSVYVEDLRITDVGSILRAATFGRGIWEYQLSAVPDPPSAPLASSPTNITSGSFQANWSDGGGGTIGYRLDVSDEAGFGDFVSGYQGLDVGNAPSFTITGLSSGVTYYYRIRAYSEGGGSQNSAAIMARTANLTVINTNDDGAGSLRRTILNALPGSTIDFALPAQSTITLTSGELTIGGKDLTIIGPGANMLTVKRAEGAAQFRPFRILSGNVTIVGLTISNGEVAGGGGGLQNESIGTVNISSCTISGNSAGSGGGIYSNGDGTINLTNSTVSGNSADNLGGGLYVTNTVNITNSTISDNTAQNNGGGLNCFGAAVNLTYSTISGNSARRGGGFHIFSTIVSSQNTIIAGNTSTISGPDIFSDSGGQFSSSGYNLIGKSSNATITSQTTDQIGSAAAPIDPKLAALSDNGGPTQTRALLADSAAIDKAGTVAGSSSDQRGFFRVVDNPAISNTIGGDGSDVGAVEASSWVIPFPTGFRLLTEGLGALSNQITAIDSVLYTRDPFAIVNGANLLNLSSDRHTRVMVFMNLQLDAGEPSSSVIVNLIDGDTAYEIPAEDVRPVPSDEVPGKGGRLVPKVPFSQVIFRIPENVPLGTCTVRLKAHGRVSNAGTILIRE